MHLFSQFQQSPSKQPSGQPWELGSFEHKLANAPPLGWK